jgi:hypothetical protein
MSSKSPDDDELDEGWDVESGWDDGDGPPSSDSSKPPSLPDSGSPTRMIGKNELFRRAGASPSGRMARVPPPPSGPSTKTTPPHLVAAQGTDQRATLPPPVPESEYVARMMGRAPASEHGFRVELNPRSSSPHRPTLATIPETDPLQFDQEERMAPPRLSSTDAPTARRQALSGEGSPSSVPREARRTSSPEIEMGTVDVQDLDPEVLRDTPTDAVPASAALADFDDLPVDEVLRRVSQVPDVPPQGRASGEPGAYDIRAGRDVAITVRADEAALPRDHDRRTLTGDELANPRSQVRIRFEAGDYSGALVIAEGMLEEHPDDAEAQRYAESCRDVLRQLYLTRLGDGGKAVRIVMAREELRWLTLDHRTGFLLSHIDGRMTIDELLDVSGMPPLDTIRAIFDLVQQGVVEVIDAPPPSSAG